MCLLRHLLECFPLIFDEVVFELQSLGLQPVLAHPERYEYFFDNLDKIYQTKEKGVLLQVSASSLMGYYGPIQKKTATPIN